MIVPDEFGSSYFFFFSSRRRHTRLQGDWSSDVCSSDLIEYAGEDHGLSKKANQIDYQRRIFQWFGHYLKDEPAQAWITNGETYLEHEIGRASCRERV